MKLFPHQVQALNETKTRNRVAYYLDMGLGKTYIGSEKMKSLGNHVNLVVCQKSKIIDWCEHFVTHYKQYLVFDLTKKDQFQDFFNGIYSGYNVVGVINYELAWRRKDLLKLKNFTLMLDESSLIQNSKAKQSKFIMKLRAENVVLLSGTPCSGKYENLWTQAKLLGWNIREREFLDSYVNFRTIDVGGVQIKIVDSWKPYKNQEHLNDMLRWYGAIFMKTEDVFELPTQNYVNIVCNPPNKYKTFMKNDIVTIDDIELVGNTSLTKLLYARQICGQYNDEKLNAFRDLLSSTNERVIVFYNFNEELKLLKDIAHELKKPIAEVNGKTRNLIAYEEDDNSVTFVQYQAGSKGLNLQKANKIVYFTPTLSVENWMQSQKRIHRIGQDRPCFYYKMVCRNSVEQSIYKALERGVDYTDALFREEVTLGSRKKL